MFKFCMYVAFEEKKIKGTGMSGSHSCFLVSIVYDHETWLNTQSRFFLSQRTYATLSDSGKYQP